MPKSNIRQLPPYPVSPTRSEEDLDPHIDRFDLESSRGAPCPNSPSTTTDRTAPPYPDSPGGSPSYFPSPYSASASKETSNFHPFSASSCSVFAAERSRHDDHACIGMGVRARNTASLRSDASINSTASHFVPPYPLDDEPSLELGGPRSTTPTQTGKCKDQSSAASAFDSSRGHVLSTSSSRHSYVKPSDWSPTPTTGPSSIPESDVKYTNTMNDTGKPSDVSEAWWNKKGEWMVGEPQPCGLVQSLEEAAAAMSKP